MTTDLARPIHSSRFAVAGLTALFAVASAFGAGIAASLGDRVWFDANGNGQQDGGEPGLAGVVVTITGTDFFGAPVSGTQTTGASGDYLFSLNPGTYTVTFGTLPGYARTVANAGPDVSDSDADQVTGVTGTYNLAPGQNDLTVDAGLVQQLATIGDKVFYDLNGNGIQDGGGETGVDGVTVQLFATSGDVLIGTTTTSGGGIYGFTTQPGDYYVRFSNLPAGYVFSPSTPSPASDADDSDADTVSGKTNSTQLVGGETDLTWDAGLVQLSSLAGYVYYDFNNDGIFQGTETGIPGATVALTGVDDLGNSVNLSTLTDASGAYAFVALRPGTYTISETQPAGYLDGKDTIGTPGGLTTNDKFSSIVLGAGVDGVANNFGEVLPPAPGLEVTKTASKTVVAPYEPVTYTYVVTNTGNTSLSNVVVTDDNGTPNQPGDDFTVGTVPLLAPGASQTFTAQVIPVVSTIGVVNGVTVPAGAIIVVIPLGNGDIKVTYYQDFGINDNTYGTGTIGWGTRIHKFGDLTGSDKLEFRFFAKDGSVPIDFYIDCITAATSVTVPGTGQVIHYPSGYGTMGPFGGDGFMVAGDRNNIVTFSTSIGDNLNNPANLAHVASLIVNSPTSLVAGNVVVDPLMAPGGWEHINTYSVVVKASTFAVGGGFGSVVVPDQHNSPNKLGGPNGMATVVVNSFVTNTATATSGSLVASGTATVSIVVQSPETSTLPSPWKTQDVGTVAAVGSASYNNGIFAVEGSGNDIGAGKDEFRFAYQTATGDCTVVAKVLSIENTNKDAVAGVMIRETLNGNSTHAGVFVQEDGGIEMDSRATTGGATATKLKDHLLAPYWVKIVRIGNVFTSYYSPDGVTWTKLDAKTIAMGANVYIGLAVNSHKDGTLCTATFSDVTATP